MKNPSVMFNESYLYKTCTSVLFNYPLSALDINFLNQVIINEHIYHFP